MDEVKNIDREIIAEKAQRMEEGFDASGSLLIAFSGGADSAYLLAAALKRSRKNRVVAATVTSAFHSEQATRSAVSVAKSLGAEHILLPVDILAETNIKNNPPERCYFCKKLIFKRLLTLAGEYNIDTVAEGSNADDFLLHRPGQRALSELAILSPLRDAGLRKAEIRALSKELLLQTWNKPAESCLATRFPCGEALAADKLNRVEAAERYLRQLGISGEMRVRCHDQLARIEVTPAAGKDLLNNKELISSYLKELGFIYVTIDLDGFRSGSMD